MITNPLREYLMKGYRRGIAEGVSSYDITQTSAKWCEAGILEAEDILELGGLLDARDTPPAEEQTEEPTEGVNDNAGGE